MAWPCMGSLSEGAGRPSEEEGVEPALEPLCAAWVTAQAPWLLQSRAALHSSASPGQCPGGSTSSPSAPPASPVPPASYLPSSLPPKIRPSWGSSPSCSTSCTFSLSLEASSGLGPIGIVRRVGGAVLPRLSLAARVPSAPSALHLQTVQPRRVPPDAPRTEGRESLTHAGNIGLNHVMGALHTLGAYDHVCTRDLHTVTRLQWCFHGRLWADSFFLCLSMFLTFMRKDMHYIYR